MVAERLQTIRMSSLGFAPRLLAIIPIVVESRVESVYIFENDFCSLPEYMTKEQSRGSTDDVINNLKNKMQEVADSKIIMLDAKPLNVVVGTDGQVRFIDFDSMYTAHISAVDSDCVFIINFLVFIAASWASYKEAKRNVKDVCDYYKECTKITRASQQAVAEAWQRARADPRNDWLLCDDVFFELPHVPILETLEEQRVHPYPYVPLLLLKQLQHYTGLLPNFLAQREWILSYNPAFSPRLEAYKKLIGQTMRNYIEVAAAEVLDFTFTASRK